MFKNNERARILNALSQVVLAVAEAVERAGLRLKRCETCGRNPLTGEPCVTLTVPPGIERA